MRRWALVLNGMCLAGVTFVLAFGFKEEAKPVLSEPLAGEAQALEAEAARAPTTKNVADLATAYLERNQSGLALSVLDQNADLSSPELSEVRARALFGQGESLKALSILRNLTASCENHTVQCPNWLLAKSLRQEALLEQMVNDGIEDPALDPVATRLAYERSNREVRLVALR